MICVYPFRLLIVPSEFNCMLDTFAAGFAKCGVLVKLKDSARSWSDHRSVNLKLRNSERSKLTVPGPRRRLNPAVPKRASVTGANASPISLSLID